MNEKTGICILCGGVGPEREISLVSGRSMEKALEGFSKVRLVELTEASLPDDIKAAHEVVFPALHGEFGEDGSLQGLLQDCGIHFAGSDAHASRLCMRKSQTREKVSGVGIRVAPGFTFWSEEPPHAETLTEMLGEDLILKPENMGSSVNLKTAENLDELRSHLKTLAPGPWLAERRIRGREVSVGILNGESLGLVELFPRNGIYDYEAKYSEGMTEYQFPAEAGHELEDEIRRMAERAFHVCGCRDFARVDFMVSGGEEIPFFIEINTLPGLTPTSLLPKSASCRGISFEELARELVKPALGRHRSAYPLQHF